MPAEKLLKIMQDKGFEHCECIPSIARAYDTAVERCVSEGIPTLFIGGSNFVIGELLSERTFEGLVP